MPNMLAKYFSNGIQQSFRAKLYRTRSAALTGSESFQQSFPVPGTGVKLSMPTRPDANLSLSTDAMTEKEALQF